jgi:NADPH:quinone reductase-like Zn-dependent oxidoreductase
LFKSLRASGAEQVFIDTGRIAEQVKEVFPRGVDRVLELVGATTLADPLRCAAWSVDGFRPMDVLPASVCLTTYDGGREDLAGTPLDELVEQVAQSRLRVQVGRVFKLDDIVEAHRCMEENRAGGKIVVLT